MRAPDRRAMVERPGKDLSVRRQCALLNLARSGLPRQAHHRGGRSGFDAPHRRTASRTAVLWLAADDIRTQQGTVSARRPRIGCGPRYVFAFSNERCLWDAHFTGRKEKFYYHCYVRVPTTSNLIDSSANIKMISYIGSISLANGTALPLRYRLEFCHEPAPWFRLPGSRLPRPHALQDGSALA